MHSILAAHHAAIAGLCRLHEVERLDVFGSATTGEFDPSRSDVDLLVSFRPGATHLDNYLALAAALEHLLGRKVDLVIERAIRNPYFRRTIEHSRLLLYAHADEEAVV